MLAIIQVLVIHRKREYLNVDRRKGTNKRAKYKATLIFHREHEYLNVDRRKGTNKRTKYKATLIFHREHEYLKAAKLIKGTNKRANKQ